MSDAMDLNLIRILCAVIETKSVTQAALRLDMYGSKVSYALHKMRDYYQDPLFYRSGSAMHPTACALELYASFKPALDIIDNALLNKYNTPTDIALTQRKLRVRTNPLLEMWIMDKRIVAPKNRDSEVNYEFYTNYLPPNKRIELLRAKQIDIDIGFPLEKDASIFQYPLFTMNTAFVGNKCQPGIKDSITIQKLKNIDLFSWLPLADAVDIDIAFAPIDEIDFIQKKWRSNSMLGMLYCLTKCEGLMVVPLALAPLICQAFPLRIVRCPEIEHRSVMLCVHILKSRKKDPLLQDMIKLLMQIKELEGIN